MTVFSKDGGDTVQQFAKSVREHWGVESAHWNLDVTF